MGSGVAAVSPLQGAHEGVHETRWNGYISEHKNHDGEDSHAADKSETGFQAFGIKAPNSPSSHLRGHLSCGRSDFRLWRKFRCWALAGVHRHVFSDRWDGWG